LRESGRARRDFQEFFFRFSFYEIFLFLKEKFPLNPYLEVSSGKKGIRSLAGYPAYQHGPAASSWQRRVNNGFVAKTGPTGFPVISFGFLFD